MLLEFIRAIATYERLLDQVEATQDELYNQLFVEHRAKVVFGEWHQKPIAFALYFYNFSTFTGKKGLYLEDIYVAPEHRNQGIGRKMIEHLIAIAKAEDCGRMEWAVLDWNTTAIRFYESLGAKPMNEWTTFRLTRETIESL
ncbi:MAG: GNAT family N-acetyltransferase [Bacillus subtilis]|nr:GNAT family N-acetyltransferase [Bacillus subtilis]